MLQEECPPSELDFPNVGGDVEMSLPLVPTSSIVVVRGRREGTLDEEGTHTAAGGANSSLQSSIETAQPNVVAARMQSTSLASLYAPSRASVAQEYPDLSFVADLRLSRHDSERTALLLPENSQLMQQLQSDNANLVAENARLRAPQAVPTVVRTEEEFSESSGAAISNPAHGIRVQGSQPHGRAGIKYVCCGTCRQWLLSPHGATYVFCPRCRSVNNCSLVSMQGEVQPAPQARPGDDATFFPRYLLDCFRGVFH